MAITATHLLADGVILDDPLVEGTVGLIGKTFGSGTIYSSAGGVSYSASFGSNGQFSLCQPLRGLFTNRPFGASTRNLHRLQFLPHSLVLRISSRGGRQVQIITPGKPRPTTRKLHTCVSSIVLSQVEGAKDIFSFWWLVIGLG